MWRCGQGKHSGQRKQCRFRCDPAPSSSVTETKRSCGFGFYFCAVGKQWGHFKCESLLSLLTVFTKNHSACHTENGFLGVQGWRKGDQSEEGRFGGQGKGHYVKDSRSGDRSVDRLGRTWFLSFLVCYCAFIFHFTDILNRYIYSDTPIFLLNSSKQRENWLLFHGCVSGIVP